jgi:hypothetical protein
MAMRRRIGAYRQLQRGKRRVEALETLTRQSPAGAGQGDEFPILSGISRKLADSKVDCAGAIV